MSLSGKARRTKGHNFERALAKKLRELTGLPWKRGLQTRAGGGEAADVLCHSRPEHFECKVGKAPPMRGALLQAERDCTDPDGIPIAVVKNDGEEPIVCLREGHFLVMFEDHLNWMKIRR